MTLADLQGQPRPASEQVDQALLLRGIASRTLWSAA